MVRLIHHVRKRLVVAVLFALLMPAGVGAQDAVVTRNVNLRQDPSTTQSPIRLLLPGAEPRLLEPGKANNYYHVATMGDEEGWVWGKNVRVFPPPPGPAEVLGGCSMEGNASRDDYRALNRLKNRATTPAASDMNAAITLPAMLQPVGDEARWSNAQGATVTGYVYDVKAGSEESVNCGATTVAGKDTHIEITLSSGDTGPRRRVVVEVTPKWRAYEAQLGELVHGGPQEHSRGEMRGGHGLAVLGQGAQERRGEHESGRKRELAGDGVGDPSGDGGEGGGVWVRALLNAGIKLLRHDYETECVVQ